MTGFVLDCSVTMAWLFEDEATPGTDAMLSDIRSDGAIVPTLWHLEVGNVLIQAERRGRISKIQIRERLSLLTRLPIKTDPETAARAFKETVDLAEQHGLSTYDAAYLELAVRKKTPLATLDKALLKAARKQAVSIR